MKALFYGSLEGPRGIRRGDVPPPEVSGSEVLVRVKAFSLNHVDLWVMEGKYPAAIPLPHVFGSDAAGVVEQIGPDVRQLKPGDAVVLYPATYCGRCKRCLGGRENECSDFSLLGAEKHGVSAEYVKAREENLFKKPEGLSFEEAACVGITFTTAWNSLVLRAGIKQGDTVFVHGAGGGAGTATIQIAKLFNAVVIATAGDDWKLGKAKDLGADHAINYLKENFSAAVKRITKGDLADIAVDHGGASTFNGTLSCLKRGGSLVTFGATGGDEVPLSLRHVFGRNITIHGIYVGARAAMQHCLSLMPGRLRPVIDSVFDFNDTVKAYEKMQGRQFFGKIVVRV